MTNAQAYITNKKGEVIQTDIPLKESRNMLQLLDLFEGKISYTELREMDLPRLNSLIEAKLEMQDEELKKMGTLGKTENNKQVGI